MPQRLNVGESLAFLIACIEASGKLDFKRLGDNLEIQPAAARMRLTRLRRAVANREFEDAILVQPGKLDPEIAALANPESRRLTEAADKARQTRKANKSTGKSELSAEIVLDSDTEVEDEFADKFDEESQDEKEVSRELKSTDPAKRSAKRKASRELLDESDGDETLFYKDTSSASRRVKHIKLEDDEDKVKTEDAADRPKSKLQTTDLAQGTTFSKNAFSAIRPVTETCDFTRPRVPHIMGRGPVLLNQNGMAMRSTFTPQQWYAFQHSQHPSIRSNISNASHDAFLAQMISQSRQPLRPGSTRKVNVQRISDREGGSMRSPHPSISIPTHRRRTNSPPFDDPKVILSSPTAVFDQFRRPIPSAYVAANPATKRVIIPKEQRALLPGMQTLDPALGGSMQSGRAESVTERSSAKRMAIRARESGSPAKQVQKIESGNDGKDGSG